MTDLANLVIKIDSSGVATASRELGGLEDKSRKVEKATDSVTGSFIKQIGIVNRLAIAYGALKLLDYAKDAVMLAARYETLGVVMRLVGNNAGYTGAQMESFAKGLEKTGISMIEARQSLARMIQAHLDLTKATQLARVAQDAAVIGNINSSEAFQRLVYGIQSGQVETLRTIGLNVNFENSYKKVAAATGRLVTSFTESEKANIRMNAAMDAGKSISGAYESAMGTAGKQVLSLERHVENLRVLFGLAFTPALAEMIDTITKAITGVNEELSSEKGLKAIQEWGKTFKEIIIEVEIWLLRIDRAVTAVAMGMTAFLNMGTIGDFTGTNNKQYEDYKKTFISEGKLIDELVTKQEKLKKATSTAKAPAEKLGSGAISGPTGPTPKEQAKIQKEYESEQSKMYEHLKFQSDRYYDYKIVQFDKEKTVAIKATGDRLLAEQDYQKKRIDLDKEYWEAYNKEVYGDAGGAPDPENNPVAQYLNNRMKYLKETYSSVDTALDEFYKDVDSRSSGALQRLNTIRENEISMQLSDLDLQEKSGRMHKDTLDERIFLTEELLNTQLQFLETINKTNDPSGYYSQTEAINKTREALLQLNDELTPFKTSMKNYAESIGDIWESVGNAGVSALKSFEDQLVEMLTTGKADWKSFADSVLKDIARITVQQAITKPIASAIPGVLGSLGSLLGAALGGGSSAPSTSSSDAIYNSGYTSANTKYFADGGWIDEPVIGRGLRSGKNYSIGEAGESELVTPKSKIGGSVVINNTTNVTVESSNGGNNSTDAQKTGESIARVIKGEFQSFLQNEMRPGGMLHKGM